MQRKFSFLWTGPFRLTNIISPYIFDIQHLISGKIFTAHRSRLRFFRNSDINVTKEILEQVSFQDGQFNIVEKLLDIREDHGVIHLQVHLCVLEGEDRR